MTSRGATEATDGFVVTAAMAPLAQGRCGVILTVADVAASLRFWCGRLGFRFEARRVDPDCAVVTDGGAVIMLQAGNRTSSSGVCLEFARPDLDALTACSHAADGGGPAVQTRWIRVCGIDRPQRQLTLVDPDGYHVRLVEAPPQRAPMPVGA